MLLQVIYLTYIAIVIAFSLLSLPNTSESLPLQYTNYTSDKYQIQFQHPSNWTVQEKTNRFEEGSDIEISNPNVIDNKIGITMSDDLLKDFGTSDLQSAVIDFHKALTTTYTYDSRTIESPTFLNIDGQRSGTFLFTFQQKYETDPITGAAQNWITFIGDRGYLFDFFANPETFDSPENTEIRDHFIKSIKFLGINNLTNNTNPR